MIKDELRHLIKVGLVQLSFLMEWELYKIFNLLCSLGFQPRLAHGGQPQEGFEAQLVHLPSVQLVQHPAVAPPPPNVDVVAQVHRRDAAVVVVNDEAASQAIAVDRQRHRLQHPGVLLQFRIQQNTRSHRLPSW